MRFENRLAYSAKDNAGIRGFSLQPLLFPLIFVLLLGLVIGLSGCSPQEPTLTTSGISTSAATITTTPTQSNLRPPLAVLLKTTPSLSTNGLVINAEYMIGNPNAEKLALGDIKISTQSTESSNLTQHTFPGAVMEGGTNTRFSFTIEIPAAMLSPKTLTLIMDAQTIGTSAPLSVQLTSPLNIAEIMDKLILKPKINLQTSVTKLGQSWPTTVEAQVEGSISNPNPLALNFLKLEILIRDQNGAVLQSGFIEGNSLAGNSDYPFKSTLLLPLEVFNQSSVTAYVYTSVQFFNNIKSINSTRVVPIPKLASLISLPEIRFNVNPAWSPNDPNVYSVGISAKLQNDNPFGFVTEGFQLKLYNNANNALLRSASTSTNTIGEIPGHNAGSLINTSFTFNSTELGKKGFEAAITGDLILIMPGVNEKIPLSARILYPLGP